MVEPSIENFLLHVCLHAHMTHIVLLSSIFYFPCANLFIKSVCYNQVIKLYFINVVKDPLSQNVRQPRIAQVALSEIRQKLRA